MQLYKILIAKGIDPKIAQVIDKVPRELFVPEDLKDLAYEDKPLPLGYNQTISQPYIVALMTQALDIKPDDKVLEIGTGSGYHTAILSQFSQRIYTIERIPELYQSAYNILSAPGGLGCVNIQFRLANGSLGWPEEAPFDKIVVSAASPSIPMSLIKQLNENGLMVIPVGLETEQQLLLIKRDKETFKQTMLCNCSFVKLIGKEGYEQSTI